MSGRIWPEAITKGICMSIELQCITVLAVGLVLELSGMTIVLLHDPYIGVKDRRIILLNTVIVITDVLLVYGMEGYETVIPRSLRLSGDILTYCLRPVPIVLFLLLLKGTVYAWIPVGINAAVYMSAFFSGIAFTITPDGSFFRGPLGYTVHIVSTLLLLACLRRVLLTYGRKKGTARLLPVFLVLSVGLAMFFDSGPLRHNAIAFLPAVEVNAWTFGYIWLYLQNEKEHEEDLLARQRIRIMVSQMQPHFIYNSLNAIRGHLDEPEEAEVMLEHFAGFLRGNIDLLESTECIPARREFDTVQNYLYLEKDRFGEKLSVITDLSDMDFLLPAFTVQTLAENAITHGIRANKGGYGTLRLTSYATENAHVIEVEDNGAGFDPFAWEEQDKAPLAPGYSDPQRLHIGLKNLRERLLYMCRGTLAIESSPGKGTRVRVEIPKGDVC